MDHTEKTTNSDLEGEKYTKSTNQQHQEDTSILQLKQKNANKEYYLSNSYLFLAKYIHLSV